MPYLETIERLSRHVEKHASRRSFLGGMLRASLLVGGVFASFSHIQDIEAGGCVDGSCPCATACGECTSGSPCYCTCNAGGYTCGGCAGTGYTWYCCYYEAGLYLKCSDCVCYGCAQCPSHACLCTTIVGTC